VYRADDLLLGQSVALKFLPAGAMASAPALNRFRNEVRTARQVSHPNVCRVYDIGEADGLTYLSMEYVDGEDLASLLRRIGKLPPEKALEIARQLCAGVAAAHDKGVIHRDLKPANIMLDRKGQVRVTDFGIAAVAEQIRDARSGTPAYMSPEQLAGKEVTARSDIYSLGIVFCELLTGKRPPLEANITGVDPVVEQVIRRCLEPAPEMRPGSALLVAAALPGGDPLAAALTRGETPAPEVVANAPGRGYRLELRQLRVFVALADKGGITAAARALNLAQSTVSEALAALERALGTPIVQRRRGTHDSILTAAGKVLLPNARAVLAAVDKTYIAVAEATVEARGAVNIAANESISTYLLPNALAHLRSRWPNTCFSVSVATCSEIRRGLENGAFDVGLLLESAEETLARPRTKTPSRSEQSQVVASAVPLLIFAAPSHQLVRRGLREHGDRSDLAEFPTFVSDPCGVFYTLIEHFFLADGLPFAPLHSAGSIEGVKRGVIADPCALGILPSYAVAEELRTGRFVHLNIRPKPPTMQVIALHSGGRELHPGAIELIEDITRALAAHGPVNASAAPPLLAR
jgi:molybdate transport repressor ModE-like protein